MFTTRRSVAGLLAGSALLVPVVGIASPALAGPGPKPTDRIHVKTFCQLHPAACAPIVVVGQPGLPTPPCVCPVEVGPIGIVLPAGRAGA